jgi:hypothetical protein
METSIASSKKRNASTSLVEDYEHRRRSQRLNNLSLKTTPNKRVKCHDCDEAWTDECLAEGSVYLCDKCESYYDQKAVEQEEEEEKDIVLRLFLQIPYGLYRHSSPSGKKRVHYNVTYVNWMARRAYRPFDKTFDDLEAAKNYIVHDSKITSLDGHNAIGDRPITREQLEEACAKAEKEDEADWEESKHALFVTSSSSSSSFNLPDTVQWKNTTTQDLFKKICPEKQFVLITLSIHECNELHLEPRSEFFWMMESWTPVNVRNVIYSMIGARYLGLSPGNAVSAVHSIRNQEWELDHLLSPSLKEQIREALDSVRIYTVPESLKDTYGTAEHFPSNEEWTDW